MRIDELKAREDVLPILARTLEDGWTEQFGTPFHARLERREEGQRWLLQPLLSALYVEDIRRDARKFLCDSFRYTPRTWRLPAQFLLGTLLGSRAGLRRAGRFALSLEPALPGAAAILVVPGNQRVRVFDFDRRTSRVFLKRGFSPDSSKVEIAVRGAAEHGAGPFLRITDFDRSGRWFEEPLVAGFALPRCPPWMDRRRFEREALERLSRWLEATTSATSFAAYVGSVEHAIETLWESLGATEPAYRRLAPGLLEGVRATAGEVAAVPGELLLAQSHGDLQAGNILVSVRDREPLFIDWERSARRQREYDAFVYGLGSRHPAGLGDRMARFLETRCLDGPADWLLSSAARRQPRPRMLLFLLEELRWHLHQNTSGRYAGPTPDLRRFLPELSRFLPRP